MQGGDNVGFNRYIKIWHLADLEHSTGENQAIWLLALKAASKAQQLRES